ncbi:hypothetical protein FI667_g14240, partial [Globisporangium splendens]
MATSVSSTSFAKDVDGAIDVRGFGDLQARLRSMSYREPVTIESVPLVKRLLSDFLHASEVKEQVERALEKSQREALELSQIILPLRKENANLTRENNSLHLEVIHQEEAIAEREKACDLQLQGLQDDIKRLQFLNGQKAQQCTRKEQEVSKLQIQLERLMSIGADAFRRQSGVDTSSIELRGSGIFSSSEHQQKPPRKLSSESQSNGLQNERIQDSQILLKLHEQISQLTSENQKLQLQCDGFTEKLNKREQEISRLSKLSLQAAKNSDDSTRKAREQDQLYENQALQETVNLQVDQLQTQVDLLNDQVAKYESRLKEAQDQIRGNNDLAERLRQMKGLNEKYSSELRSLQLKYQALEEEHFRGNDASQKVSRTNEMQSSLISNDPKVDEQLGALKEQVASLTAQRDRLEDALRATHYDKISYTNALSNANSHNRVLANDLARAESKLTELSSNHAKLQQSLADVKATLESQTREVKVLRESLKQSEDNRVLESEKNVSLHRELRAMDKVLSQRDEECRALNYSLLNQKAEVDRLTSKLEAMNNSIANDEDSASQPNSTRKSLFAQEIKWLEEERQELRRGKEELMLQVMNVEEELQVAKSSAQKVELDKQKLAEKLDVSTKLQANLENMLEDKKKECLELENRLAESRERIREVQGQYNQSQVLLHRADDTENEKIQVQNEALGLRKLVEELRDANASLKNRIENEDVHANRLEDQMTKMNDDLTLLRKTNSTLEKEHIELKRNYESVMSDLRNSRQVCNHYQNEYEKLAKELQNQQHFLSSEVNALHSSQSSLAELKSQVRQLQSELGLKQNTIHQLQTRLDQEKLSLKTVQSELALTQDELLQTKETNRAREMTVKQLRDDIQTKDRGLTEKAEAVENFKLLIEQMESSRDQMLFKVKTQQQQIQRHHQETEDLQSKLSLIEKEVLSKATEISSLKKLTRTLDSEKDSLHDQLDTLTEKYHEVVEQNNQLREGVQSESTSANALQEQLVDLVNQLNDQEDRHRKLQTHCSQLESEVDRLEHIKGMYEAEMTALAQDLENMTIENQALSEECTRLQFAHQSQNQSTSSLKMSVRQAERERDALNIELEDLRHTYRSLIQEHEGMERARAQVAELHEELGIMNEALRKQVTSLENELHVMKEKHVTASAEAATYRDQVSFLTDKLQTNEQALAETENRQQDLQHELETQKQIATEISAQRYGAQAQNAAVSQRIVHLEAKLSNSKFETRALQEKLQAEQSQRRALEDLVTNLRQKIAANDTLIGHLEEQRQTMAQEIQSTHQRRVVADEMDMSELNHTPPERGQNDSRHALSGRNGSNEASPSLSSRYQSRANSEVPASESDGGLGNSASSLLPLRSLEEAQRKCKELEDRLTQQDDTIKQLERSRSKFKRFAVKYEREIEQVRSPVLL